MPRLANNANKLSLWLKYFLNESNTTTFLQRTESAKAAGYKCNSQESFRNVGNQNYTKCTKEIEKWLDEFGLSENKLKQKLLDLMSSNETIFKSVKGGLDSGTLPENVKIIAKTGIMGHSENGDTFGDGETLLGIDVENKELQRRTLDMAIKVRGMYAAEKREISGPGGGAIEFTDTERAARLAVILENARKREKNAP